MSRNRLMTQVPIRVHADIADKQAAKPARIAYTLQRLSTASDPSESRTFP